MEPIFEREFAPQSYGFRPGRSCQDALRRVDELLRSGQHHVVEIDIRGYFDAIVAKLNPILRGWYGYFRHASASALGEMDGSSPQPPARHPAQDGAAAKAEG